MVTPSQTVARVDTFLIAVLPQAGQHHLNVNEGAVARQAQGFLGWFICGTPCGVPIVSLMVSGTFFYRRFFWTGLVCYSTMSYSRRSHRHLGVATMCLLVRAEAAHAIRPGRLRSLSHRHLASPSALDGQSGRTCPGKERCVHSLHLLTCAELF